MIQATGLTSTPRRNHPPVIDDLTFEAPPGRVTVLLGGSGAGKTSALRLLLQLDRGHGSVFFRGRPLHRIRRPAREIGVLLEDVPGHPGRTARSHLRMLGAAVGVPASRADVVLDVVGLTDLADERIGDLAAGMERRLGIATALLGDPHTLILDNPARGLSARETAWLHGLLRGFAAQGGAVLVTSDDPEGVIRLADRVLTLEGGRLVADQPVEEFARTRLRPRVVVRSPLAGRLAAVLEDEAHAIRQAAEAEAAAEAAARAALPAEADEAAEAVKAGGSAAGGTKTDDAKGAKGGIKGEKAPGSKSRFRFRFRTRGAAKAKARPELAAAASGATPAAATTAATTSTASTVTPAAAVPTATTTEIGTVAADGAVSHDGKGISGQAGAAAEVDTELEGTTVLADPFSVVRDDEIHISVYGLPTASVGEAAYRHGIVVHRLGEETADMGPTTSAGVRARDPEAPPPRFLPRLRLPGPAWPMRYELRRATGVRTGWIIAVASIVTSLLASVLLARAGITGELHRVTGWPADLPLPPVAIAAGLLGALAFGEEFRYPALAPAHDTVPRRLGLLSAKFVVCAAGAILLSVGVVVLDSAALLLLVGGDAVPLPGDWPELTASLVGLTVGSSWAGLLAAGVFRSTALGLATLLAVPVLAVPVVQRVMQEPELRSLAMLPHRLRAAALERPTSEFDRMFAVLMRLAGQPVGQALMLSVAVLLCAYALTGLRGRSTRQ
ncbi:ABC transporter ATP-binding protein [Streptomyces sp. NA02950]|uniref:ATP-binding cassette domain-containing protein n=1 Tax=Streptomyces sp. NA02950 TaxID=2742137 RepID=UPI0015923A48|nr:ABC transporter ATP-binding protein [Streptomyces sp. NA02950]QKV92166.1 ABC transporter ATP-binding protein [Streptomyces sp. NA02950]